MSDIVELTLPDIPSLIHSSPLVVIRASIWPQQDFNKTFLEMFKGKYPANCRFGWINIAEIDFKKPFVKFIADAWLKSIGLSSSNGVPPGYYLFKDGVLVGMHPGTVDWSQDKTTIKVGVGIIGITSLLSQKMDYFSLIKTVFDVNPAQRIMDFFNEVLAYISSREAKRQQDKQRKHQQRTIKDDLKRAYSILGVSPTASNKEVQNARKRAAKKVHPDNYTNDPEMCERMTQVMAQINNAYDLIAKERQI